jgi:hypothetical protein
VGIDGVDIQEYAVLAVKGLMEGNERNQELIRELERLDKKEVSQ